MLRQSVECDDSADSPTANVTASVMRGWRRHPRGLMAAHPLTDSIDSNTLNPADPVWDTVVALAGVLLLASTRTFLLSNGIAIHARRVDTETRCGLLRLYASSFISLVGQVWFGLGTFWLVVLPLVPLLILWSHRCRHLQLLRRRYCGH
jgi:hypothetical protein